MSFDSFFSQATGLPAPFPYQRRLAENALWPARVEVPTGLGKTAAIVVAHLYQRKTRPLETPRRLVYVLPMRVLVEQTLANVKQWVSAADAKARVVSMMGGAVDETWDLHPDEDAILVGTQDQLLSRALNRGFTMSRYRWPMHFGLLHNDCRWVIDEVQLVGSGVATTAQLQAFRRKLGTLVPTTTTWMSATLDESWLRTVDVEDVDVAGQLVLDPATDGTQPAVRQRLVARKKSAPASSEMGAAAALAKEIRGAHREGTRTIVICNTVDRATDLFMEMRRQAHGATIVLVQ